MRNYLTAVMNAEFVRRTGKVTQFFGLVVESNGPDVFVGELCEIYPRTMGAPILAEVVGLRDNKVLSMPYRELRGVSLGSEVIATGHSAYVSVGKGILGRVIDAFGEPLDNRPLPPLEQRYPVYPEPLNPLSRVRISEILETGVKAIDGMLAIGRGQRVGIFSGSGVGKSTLLGMIARNMNADVNVIALVGERGREVRDFIEEILGREGLKRSVVVVATSDQPALVRAHAALTATAIAEYFRDRGLDVVLTMDSVTRYAMALREIGLAVGEPPTARGYTPSVFASLPRLLERGGTSENGGSITAFYTVLIEGDDVNDPVADSIRSILDGHIVLSRDLANRGQYPAIDVLHSNSRLLRDLVDRGELESIHKAINFLATYRDARDMIDIGAYKSGTNPLIDAAIQKIPDLEAFLKQAPDEPFKREQTIKALTALLSHEDSGK